MLTEFGAQELIQGDEIEFVLLTKRGNSLFNVVKELSIIITVGSATQADLEAYLRKHASFQSRIGLAP